MRRLQNTYVEYLQTTDTEHAAPFISYWISVASSANCRVETIYPSETPATPNYYALLARTLEALRPQRLRISVQTDEDATQLRVVAALRTVIRRIILRVRLNLISGKFQENGCFRLNIACFACGFPSKHPGKTTLGCFHFF